MHLRLEVGEFGGEVFGLLGVFVDVVDFEGIAVLLDVVADADVLTEADHLHLLAGSVLTVFLEFGVFWGFAAIAIFDVNLGRFLAGLPGEGGDEGGAIRASGGADSGEFGEGGEPVVGLAGVVVDAAFWCSGGPADERSGANAAFPDITLDAIEGAKGVEEVGVVLFGEVGFFAGSVIGGEDDEGVVVDFEFFEMIDEVADTVIDATHVGGITLVNIGPAFFGGGWVVVMIPSRLFVVGMGVAVLFANCGVDHLPFLAEPLEAFFGKGTGWELENRVGGIVCEIDEEGFFRTSFFLVGDPFFSARGEEVGGEAFVEIVRDLVFVLPQLHSVFFGIVHVSVSVTDVAVEEVETTFGGIGWPNFGVF